MLEILVQTKTKEEKELAVMEDGVLTERYIENEKQKRLEGNIYIGKVENVLKGIQAAFVNLGEDKNAYIHVKDMIPSPDNVHGTKEVKMTSLDIRQFVHEGEYILVQVKRDATNLKGARVSTHISLPGRFCVYLPNADFITVSQKITKKEEKNRLKEIAKKYLPEHTGVILRTSVEGKSEEVIKQDLMEMQAQWETIQKKAQKALAQEQKQTQLLYQVEGMTHRLIRDLMDVGLERIRTNDEKIAKSLQEKLAKTAPQIEIETTKDIEALYRYEKQVEKVSNRKIWLACGGFITIDKTEALTAIDVNSGKFTGKQSLAETILKVNEEATVEITKQLRARDIGGIIIIDYIDMERKQDKEKILSLFAQEMKKDRSKIQIVGFTPLDLLEVTRKHMCSNLENKEEEKHENKI